MRGFNLFLYHNNTCNLKCDFCTAKNNTNHISDRDIINFINNNKKYINHEEISITGGEPTINISDSMLDFLCDSFSVVVMNSNMVSEKNLDRILNKENVILIPSWNGINDNTRNAKECMHNIEKYSNRFDTINYVVTNSSISDMYDSVVFAKKINKKINFLFQEGNSEKIDCEMIGYQLDKIILDRMHSYVSNFTKIEYDNIEESCNKCYKNSIYINHNGEISKCSHQSGVYHTNSNILGDIYNNSLVDFTGEPYMGRCDILSNAYYDFEYLERIRFDNVFKEKSKRIMYKLNIESLTLFLTEQCNMACTYCFEQHAKKNKKMMSNEIIKKAIDIALESNNNKVIDILLFGGEPSMNIDGIEYAIDYYIENMNKSSNKITFSINTNMYYINQRIVDVYDKIASVTDFTMSVSMDGCKENHDVNRIDHGGNGTYDRVINNVKFLLNNRKTKYLINKHTVMNRESIPLFKEIVNEMINHRKLFCSQTITLMSCDKNVTDDFTVGDFEKIISDRIELISNSTADNAKIIDEYLASLMIDIDFIFKNQSMPIGLCNAGEGVIAIRANGDILPCHAFIDYEDEYLKNATLDKNILDLKDNYIEIDSSSNFYKYYDKNEKIKKGIYIMESEEGYDCKTCHFRGMCHACLANGLVINDDNKLIRSKERCDRTMRMAEAIIKFKEIQVEQDKIEFLKQQEAILQNIMNGVMATAEVAISNRMEIDNIKNEIFGGISDDVHNK